MPYSLMSMRCQFVMYFWYIGVYAYASENLMVKRLINLVSGFFIYLAIAAG